MENELTEECMEIVFPESVNKNLDKLTGIGAKYQEYLSMKPVPVIRILLGPHRGEVVPGKMGGI